MTIFTHRNVDLDNCLSVPALKYLCEKYRNADVIYVDANWDGPMNRDDIALDIFAGGRGMKGEKLEGGTTLSSLALVVNAYASEKRKVALEPLVRFVNAYDAYGDAVGHLYPDMDPQDQLFFTEVSLVGIFRALKAARTRDHDMVKIFTPIFIGMLKNGRALQEAHKLIEKSDQVQIMESGLVAIVRNVKNSKVNELLYKQHGVKAVVFAKGFNLGVSRGPGVQERMDCPEARAVVKAVGELDEWFAHPSGFLFCRGSGKAQAKSASRVDQLDLAEAIDKWLQLGEEAPVCNQTA